MGLKARQIENEFEETLSLIDLPITPISTHDTKSSLMIRQEQNRPCFKTEDVDHEEQSSSEFDFGSTQFEMSSADKLFLHGQILPLRLSVDSRMARFTIPGRPDSVCDSRNSSVEFSGNSRSSSYSSTSSVNDNNVVKTTTYQPKIRNQFHAHRSPTPLLRLRASSTVGKTGSTRCRKSSVWDVFRLGPVQPPGIELKDLKIGHTQNPTHNRQDKNPTMKQSMFGMGNVGCRCTAEVVEHVQTKIVVMRSADGERRMSDIKEGEIEVTFKRRFEEDKRRRRKEEVLPGRRTFEWLKQLSVEGNVKY